VYEPPQLAVKLIQDGALCPAPAVVNVVGKACGRACGGYGVRKAERELGRLQRQAKFHGMTEEEATMESFYVGSAGGEELSDTLRDR
jgi:hypothetical protein